MFSKPFFGLLLAGLAIANSNIASGGEKTATDSNPLGLPMTYVAKLKDAPDSARIAVIVDGDAFVAYVCSADAEFNQDHSRWFRGAIKDGSGKLTVNGITLEVSLSGDRIRGTLSKTRAHSFAAQPATGGAGLFRAEDKIEDDTFVVGWIIDADDNVVGTGAGQNPNAKDNKVQTLQPPKPGQPLAAKVGENKPVLGQRVDGVNTSPSGTPAGNKLSAAERNQLLIDTAAGSKVRGGNLAQSVLLHQMRRIMAKTPAANPLEQKIQNSLKKIPAAQMKQIVDAFDALPKKVRDDLLGATGSALSVNQSITSQSLQNMLKQRINQIVSTVPNVTPMNQGKVKSFKINTLSCINETGTIRTGRDEIFAVYGTSIGGQVSTKNTSVLKMNAGDSKNWPASDALLFQANPAAGERLFVIATLFEDDGAGSTLVATVAAPFVASILLGVYEGLTDKTFTDAQVLLIATAAMVEVNLLMSGLAAMGLLTQTIATDGVIVRPDGKIIGDNGAQKDKMVFRQLRNNGSVKAHYELKGFVAEAQK